MTHFDMKDLLEALGPTASLIFAAWIFLSFLQSRYTTAYQIYRSLVAEFRDHRERDDRRQSLQDQVLEYKRRCEQMRLATQIGLAGAILLILVLVFGALNVLNNDWTLLKPLTALSALGGLILVICAALLVLKENARLQRIIESDISDIPDLRDRVRDTKHQRGTIRPRYPM